MFASTVVLPGVLAHLGPTLDHYGYAAVATLVFLEDFGVPVPGETILLAGAVYAGAGVLNPVLVGLVALAGAIIGDNVGYAIGHLVERRFVVRFGRYVMLTEERIERAERFFEHHGGKIIVIARFVEGLRQANGIIAGLTLLPWRRFLFFNAIGAVLWVACWLTVGVTAGNHIDAVYHGITSYSLYAVGVVILVLVGIVVRRRVRSRRVPPAPNPGDGS